MRACHSWSRAEGPRFSPVLRGLGARPTKGGSRSTPMREEYQLMNIVAVATALSCTPAWVYALCRQGLLAPPLKRGRRSYWVASDIRESIASMLRQAI